MDGVGLGDIEAVAPRMDSAGQTRIMDSARCHRRPEPRDLGLVHRLHRLQHTITTVDPKMATTGAIKDTTTIGTSLGQHILLLGHIKDPDGITMMVIGILADTTVIGVGTGRLGNGEVWREWSNDRSEP